MAPWNRARDFIFIFIFETTFTWSDDGQQVYAFSFFLISWEGFGHLVLIWETSGILGELSNAGNPEFCERQWYNKELYEGR